MTGSAPELPPTPSKPTPTVLEHCQLQVEVLLIVSMIVVRHKHQPLKFETKKEQRNQTRSEDQTQPQKQTETRRQRQGRRPRQKVPIPAHLHVRIAFNSRKIVTSVLSAGMLDLSQRVLIHFAILMWYCSQRNRTKTALPAWSSTRLEEGLRLVFLLLQDC